MHGDKETIEQLSTIQDFMDWGARKLGSADLFYGHGTDNALDEATYLILHTLNLSHDLAPEDLQADLPENDKQAILQVLEQRIIEQKPAAYLTNEAWFSGLSFYVDERVLIPRSPIAELIEERFSPWVKEGRVNRILDLCTGSGCIAIASAYAFPEAVVDAVDLSDDALQVARINIERHEMNDRVFPVKSDLFSNLSGQTYDIIVSNPPYVSKQEMEQLPREYMHEPAFGLESGKEGLDATITILRQSAAFLEPNGILVVEVGNSEDALVERFPEIPFMWLEFERGGHGVFLLTAEQLNEYGGMLASGN
ncbi:MAG: 50S ribosomal protein L3 N(5)-glutamine methyltransferase [Gammaproteobacteria bacterium]|nr:50S ribosomal protein L3 N(5)-glutamine methyltransferase [Gammaproteobacteria bacterium]